MALDFADLYRQVQISAAKERIAQIVNNNWQYFAYTADKFIEILSHARVYIAVFIDQGPFLQILYGRHCE